jgi:hypothetical protein
VIECDADGNVRIPKTGGLSVGGVDVATENFVTLITDNLDTSVSQLVTASTNHGQRLTSIEGAGYATTSQLSTYATATSLGDTNDTVGGINTRVDSLQTAGYVTSAGMSGYDFATEGYVATTDVLNNINIGVSASAGATAGVNVTNKAVLLQVSISTLLYLRVLTVLLRQFQLLPRQGTLGTTLL